MNDRKALKRKSPRLPSCPNSGSHDAPQTPIASVWSSRPLPSPAAIPLTDVHQKQVSIIQCKLLPILMEPLHKKRNLMWI
ncbi:unnamed protein product [Musa textilis]